jgi:hypothetical protein
MLIDDDEIRTDTQRPRFKPSHTRTLGSCDVTYSGYAGGEIGGFNIGGTNLK